MQYQDGSLISLIPATQGGGITYTHTTGVSTHFGPHDDLPLQVRDKMTNISSIERLLKQTKPISNGNGNSNSNSCGNYGENDYNYKALNCMAPKTNCNQMPLTRDVNNHAMRFFR